MKTLKQAKRFGGLALPNLQNYYKAAHIQTVQIWLTEEKTKWKLIELAPCRGMEKILPFLDSKLQLKIDNKWFQNTLRVWNKVKRDLNVHKEILLLREIIKDPKFFPSKEDGTFKTWNQKGLSIFGQFIGKKGIVEFEILQKEYGLPHSHFFRYLQVRSYIENNNIKGKKLTDLNVLIQFLIKNYNTWNLKHHISALYSIL